VRNTKFKYKHIVTTPSNNDKRKLRTEIPTGHSKTLKYKTQKHGPDIKTPNEKKGQNLNNVLSARSHLNDTLMDSK
jgi:hypothetical protein